MIGVTLEGTVIHRSGLITGGQGSSSSRKFDDNEVDRKSSCSEWKTKLMNQGSRSSRRNTLKSSRNSTNPNPKIRGMKVFSRI
jgi:chromosome segregation ATPase